MKKILFALMFLCAVMAKAQDWTAWKSSPCYKNIYYRYQHIKQQGDRHVWNIQFKNTYKKQVYFNYALAGELEDDNLKLPRRTFLPSNKEGMKLEFYTNSTNFNIEIGNLSFDRSMSKIKPCDQEKTSNK